MIQKQVNKSYYKFSNYVDKKRFTSIWHQLDEVLSLQPSSVLEIGPGPGVFRALARHFGLFVKTVDFDPELKPDCVAAANSLPFKDDSYHCVCAFEVLEHLPYEMALQAFGEIVRVSERHIVISLPDAKTLYPYIINIPKIGEVVIHIPGPRFKLQRHLFKGDHYWEINKQNYPLNRIINDFSLKNVKLNRTYRVKEYPPHRFFIFEKI